MLLDEDEEYDGVEYDLLDERLYVGCLYVLELLLVVDDDLLVELDDGVLDTVVLPRELLYLLTVLEAVDLLL